MSSSSSWEIQLRESLRSVEDLLGEGLISSDEAEGLRPVLARYRFLLPRYYAGLIDRKNRKCPIRLQGIPSVEEMAPFPGTVEDPLRDLDHRPASRVTHRYRGRALLQLTPSCSMYCRFCFRKSLLNDLKEELFDGDWTKAITYFASRGDLQEVILSGGDPLLVSDRALEQVMAALAGIPHLKRVRVHTRVPVTLPARVTDSLVGILSGMRLQAVVVNHFNHPKELTAETAAASSRLRSAGITLLNQSVLLKRVNDDGETLIQLSEGLFEQGILPYYLHHPDPALGTAGFQIPEIIGRRIHERLKERLPGYLVPRYVKDVVGHPYKVPV